MSHGAAAPPARCKRQESTRCIAYQPCGRLRCSRWRCASPLPQVGAMSSAPVRMQRRGRAGRTRTGGGRGERRGPSPGLKKRPSPCPPPPPAGLEQHGSVWSALAELHDTDAAVGSALPPAALLRRLQLAADPAADRPEIVGPAHGTGLDEVVRRTGRSLLLGGCFGCSGSKPPSPPYPPAP